MWKIHRQQQNYLKTFIMKQRGHTIRPKNIVSITIFASIQIFILTITFKNYVNTVEGIPYYSQGSLIWASIFTGINFILYYFFTRASIGYYSHFTTICLSLFLVFGFPSMLKQQFDYTAIVSVILLVFGLGSAFIAGKKLIIKDKL